MELKLEAVGEQRLHHCHLDAVTHWLVGFGGDVETIRIEPARAAEDLVWHQSVGSMMQRFRVTLIAVRRPFEGRASSSFNRAAIFRGDYCRQTVLDARLHLITLRRIQIPQTSGNRLFASELHGCTRNTSRNSATDSSNFP